ncbi:hypothetical protein SLA2020_451550 [Shorea laevis]
MTQRVYICCKQHKPRPDPCFFQGHWAPEIAAKAFITAFGSLWIKVGGALTPHNCCMVIMKWVDDVETSPTPNQGLQPRLSPPIVVTFSVVFHACPLILSACTSEMACLLIQ